MTSTLIFLIAVCLLLVLLAAEVPVGIALLGVSFIGIALARSFGVAMASIGQLPFNASSSYSLAVVPLYVLTGTLVTKSGIATDLFSVARYVFKRVPGGLALSGIAGSAGFAAVTGSSVATVASVGRTSILEMRRHGYSKQFASGVIASAGTLGILIPPSVVLVLFGITTETSIGRLLIAGVIPGILSAIVLGVAVLVLARRSPERVGLSQGKKRGELQNVASPTLSEVVSLLKVTALFIIIVGGVYGGWYTATEAGAIGATTALFLLLLSPRVLSPVKQAYEALVDAARLTSSIFIIVVGGALFTYLIVSLKIPQTFANWAISLNAPSWSIIIIILLIMIPLGMFLDSISIVLVFIPIVAPIVSALGYDMIWFAILAVKLIEVGLVTPPVGMNAFVIAGTIKDIKAETVFKGVLPFIVVDLILVAIMFLIPQIITFLPQQMR